MEFAEWRFVAMMTIHKLTSGTGYTYLTRQVAGGDVPRQAGQSAADYYTAQGNPPGHWIGRGAPLLDLQGRIVTESQMRHLFGLGQHPDADRIIAAHLRANVGAATSDQQLEAAQNAAISAAKLGRAFPQYEALAPFGERVAQRLEVLAKEARREPTQAEVKKVQREESARRRAAVAGFDIVFAPVKSAAVLWALDERETVRAAVRQAHEAAREAAFDLLEEHAAFTRTGSTGQAQIETKGLIAAVFDHYDSRAGDPNLHTHVAVSSKVQGVDGKWRSLDARALYAMTVAASEFYNSRFEVELSARLGVTFTDRPSTSGREPIREITGIPAEFITHFSSRRTEIEARYEQLLQTYRAEHGRDPSKGVAHQLARQANLDTREGKKAARSLAEMRTAWRRSLTDAFGNEAVQRLMAAVPASPQPATGTAEREIVPADVEALAARTIAAVAEERATWTVWNVRAQAERLARAEHSAGNPEEHRRLVEQIVAATVSPAHSVAVSAPALLAEPDELRRSDGTSVFEQHASVRYTSRAVLAAEARLVAAATTETAVGLSGPFTKAALDGYEGRHRVLDDGQRALVTAFATDRRMLVVGLGPAGSGKTSAMQAYVHVAAQAGQRVVPLATSAASAAVLGRDLGVRAENLHKFLWEYTHGPAADRLRHGGSVPRSRTPFILRPGDVVLVDEAGMAGTFNLDRLVAIAADRGAVVRLVGDFRQLASVESGGALREIATAVGAVELTSLHRFNDPAEADATLLIRVGDNAGLDFYLRDERVVGGSRVAMVEAAYEGWKADMLAGKTTLISAAAGIDVTSLSARARADRVGAGQVEPDGVLLRDGNRAGAGDWIVTRENDRRLGTARGRDFVKNGDAWRVVARRADGSLKVRHLDHGGRIVLPAAYVEQHVQLLYASTVMRSQGSTVDTAHPLVTEEMTRENLYVALSRARQRTTLYTVTHDLLPFDTDEQLDATKHDPDTFAAREVLERVLRREGAQLSATATIRALQEEATSLATLVPRFEHAGHALTRDHYDRLVRESLGSELGGQVSEDPAFSAVTRALRSARARGWQAEQLLAAAARQGDLDHADSPAQLLAWRINNYADDRVPAAHLAASSDHDAARYATLLAVRLGVPAERFPAEAATNTPALLRTRTRAAAPGGHPYVSAEILRRYAQQVSEVLGVTADTVTAHPSWPNLTGSLTAAQRAGQDVDVLVRRTRPDIGDAIADLAVSARARLVEHGVPADQQSVPAALCHRADAHLALGDDLAHRARAEQQWPALTAALRRAEQHGYQPADLLRAVADSRSLTGADSISLTLAWRLNQHLAKQPEPAVRAAATVREAETWRTLAWTLKAAEASGATAEELIADAANDDLTSVLTTVRQRARPADDATDSTARAGLPPWIAVTTEPGMSPLHHTYLDDSAHLIADRVGELGERAAASRPRWSEDLGPAPQDPTAHALWQRHLATIAAYRDQYQVTDDNPRQPAGPYIESGRAGHAAYWHATAAAVAAQQIAATPEQLDTSSTSPDRTAHRRLAADVFRTLPDAEQARVVDDLARRTGAPWITTTTKMSDAALRDPLIGHHLAEALAQRGHLRLDPNESTPEQAQPPTAPGGTARPPTLAERRRAGREAERQAHRDQLLQRRGNPNSTIESVRLNSRPATTRRIQPPITSPVPSPPAQPGLVSPSERPRPEEPGQQVRR